MTKTLRFCLPTSKSPTYFNLAKQLQKQAWKCMGVNWRTHFNESHFQFSLAAAQCLEFKHLLSELIAPAMPEIMPVTHYIDDKNWPEVLEKLVHQYSAQNHFKPIWILKPALLNNGQHIKIFQTLEQIAQHYKNPKRMGGAHVLQHYLTTPHLLQGPKQGHKYSIRMFVVLTNYAGCYLYPKGYFNIALQPYASNEWTDLRAHLTNEHLQDGTSNVVQIPTEQYNFFQPLYPQIKSIVSTTLCSLQNHFPQAFTCNAQRTLAIFGFDFMVTDAMRVYLLEANHAPCFPTTAAHPLQNSLYELFWQALISHFVLPIATRQPIESIQYPSFERIDVAWASLRATRG